VRIKGRDTDQIERQGGSAHIVSIQPEAQNGIDVASLPAAGVTMELSRLAQMAVAYDMKDVHYSSYQTQFSYYNHNRSMSMHVRSSTDVHVHTERISLDLVFSAEALGLTADDFAETNGKPIRLRLKFQQSELFFYHRKSLRRHYPLRKPEDILYDIATALREAVSNRGDKSISLVLDMEAIRSLIGSAPVRELLDEVIALIGIVNSLKLYADQLRDRYTVVVSGKGKPVTTIEEETRADLTSSEVELTLTINPPGSTDEDKGDNSTSMLALGPGQPLETISISDDL